MLSGRITSGYPDFIARFDGAAARWPERTALRCGTLEWTYAQLRQQAIDSAALLAGLTLAPDAAVLLCLPRGAALLAAMIGCQYLGVPYIPIGWSTPPARLQQMLGALPGSVVLHDSASPSHPGLSGIGAGVALVDLAARNAGQPRPAHAGGREAYRIFTSGSTGVPKAVMVTTLACANLLDHFSVLLADHAAPLVLSSTSPGFDIFYLEYALALANGATLVLADEQQAASPQALARLLTTLRPALYQSTPSLLKCLLPYLAPDYRFDTVLVGGEALGQQLSGTLFARARHAYNVYGPTETTVWSTWMRLEAPGERRIGVPIQNTLIAIVDADGRAVASGESGRLLIGGDGLALGYLGQPQLTAEKFGHAMHDDVLWYDTGDIGFIDADGLLNFVTRAGDYVKVNGHRIELLEVSDALEALPFVAEAAVLCVRDRHDVDTLAAFIKTDPRTPCADPVGSARAELARLLPAYMQPHSLTVVADFPRNSAGKLDRKALAPLVQVPVTPASPATGLAGDIAALLAPYLNVSRLGPDDNLFAQGLTSMHAVSFHLDLAAHWPHIELFHVFEHPTLSRLSALAAEQPCTA
ncbi:AMP-binding protein [Pseudoduganella plicata]|uniref:AMP-binding protein n=1 Tax=Pseudoduganella plicata TaxID=321984 RepID=A0A4P7BHX0_9BURK|nr:AMP-binding protein [Pseudoduganella plicata]QBQ38414.1 hypothetical protein E1742_21220 [Pseudoduganella plicata]GGY81904.1 hypothetical protein GCM10007388_13430 [Pseudoduganella plicata]